MLQLSDFSRWLITHDSWAVFLVDQATFNFVVLETLRKLPAKIGDLLFSIKSLQDDPDSCISFIIFVLWQVTYGRALLYKKIILKMFCFRKVTTWYLTWPSVMIDGHVSFSIKSLAFAPWPIFLIYQTTCSGLWLILSFLRSSVVRPYSVFWCSRDCLGRLDYR